VSGLDELTREELIALVIELHNTVQDQAGRIAQLENEVARLSGPKAKPDWVKPNAPKEEKGPRKKRMQSFARQSLPATQVRYHAVDECPECGRELTGGNIKWKHQVIDIPRTPIEVTAHLFVERYCGVCQKRWVPDAGAVLGDVVVGKKSVGIRLMSLIAHLKTSCRVPIGLIRHLLFSLYGVKISRGEIAEVLHAVSEIGKPEYESLLEKVRGSPVVHGDETGWRQDGVNGWLWSFSTPQVRYFTHRLSRGSVVVTEVLGEEFAGTLVSDFYGAYNVYDGLKQRCWIHFGRDLKSLSEKHTDDQSVVSWVDAVLGVYYRARETVSCDYPDMARCRLRIGFESELQALAEPYLAMKAAPQRVLAQRIDRFLGELFTFVQHPGVPSENNAAERAIRPAVIARKVSGGTRSSRGSATMSVLRSLFETWRLQDYNPIDACQAMIIRHNVNTLNQPA
jgi:transposase